MKTIVVSIALIAVVAGFMFGTYPDPQASDVVWGIITLALGHLLYGASLYMIDKEKSTSRTKGITYIFFGAYMIFSAAAVIFGCWLFLSDMSENRDQIVNAYNYFKMFTVLVAVIHLFSIMLKKPRLAF